MIQKIQDTSKASHLFADWEETIIWSCLQGVMGGIYADIDIDDIDMGEYRALPGEPCLQSAMAFLGDFIFLAGKPDEALTRFYPSADGSGKREFAILVPQNKEWEKMIEDCFGSRAKKVTRYAIKKESGIFDKKKLQEAVQAFAGAKAGMEEGTEEGTEYKVKEIDESVFLQCIQNEWSRDLTAQYKDYAAYQKLGLGMAVLKNGELAAGASAYSRYREGIEIQIDTRKDCRRQGLAYACGAALILECLKRGLYPSWDAQNTASVALAQKLGYHFSHTYTAYEVEGNAGKEDVL